MVVGRDSAIFLISWRWGSVNFGGRPPAYLASSDSNPSSLKLWSTVPDPIREVNATLAIAATSIPCADNNTICARRQLTTEPEPRLMIDNSRRPSSFVSSRTCTLCAIRQGNELQPSDAGQRHPQRCRTRH